MAIVTEREGEEGRQKRSNLSEQNANYHQSLRQQFVYLRPHLESLSSSLLLSSRLNDLSVQNRVDGAQPEDQHGFNKDDEKENEIHSFETMEKMLQKLSEMVIMTEHPSFSSLPGLR